MSRSASPSGAKTPRHPSSIDTRNFNNNASSYNPSNDNQPRTPKTPRKHHHKTKTIDNNNNINDNNNNNNNSDSNIPQRQTSRSVVLSPRNNTLLSSPTGSNNGALSPPRLLTRGSARSVANDEWGELQERQFTTELMLNYLLDNLEPMIWTKKKECLSNFEAYFFSQYPQLSEQQITEILCGRSKGRGGLLETISGKSWRTGKIKKASAIAVDLLLRFLDAGQHPGINDHCSSIVHPLLIIDC